MALSLSNAVLARLCLALTIGLFLYYFLWVSVVPFLLIDEGTMSHHAIYRIFTIIIVYIFPSTTFPFR